MYGAVVGICFALVWWSAGAADAGANRLFPAFVTGEEWRDFSVDELAMQG